MKISRDIRTFHSEMSPFYFRLKEIVDGILSDINPRWHYESRVKELESLALKIETGRIARLGDIDDFFAATLVVENTKSIAGARNELLERFCLHFEKPKCPEITHKKSSSFEFDDLRLCLSYPKAVQPELQNLKFEIQIKTFLQHAWAIATHDMVYKGDNVSWALSRIAYQVKAMLEHAEASIEMAETLSRALALKRSDNDTMKLNDLSDLIRTYWDNQQVPNDTKRLAENINSVLKFFDISIDDLDASLAADAKLRSGSMPYDLSPYLAVVQVLINRFGIVKLNSKKGRSKIVVTSDIILPPIHDISNCPNVVFISRD